MMLIISCSQRYYDKSRIKIIKINQVGDISEVYIDKMTMMDSMYSSSGAKIDNEDSTHIYIKFYQNSNEGAIKFYDSKKIAEFPMISIDNATDMIKVPNPTKKSIEIN